VRRNRDWFWKTAKFNEESFAEQNLSQPVQQV
jgi:hypothetical protein